ncbi:MAG: hypothetical protein OXH99_00085 [Bryobacterales bacterium]|nr:hypothetical protein [Bryobacterales bacterium]
MDVKSVITYPSERHRLSAKGPCEIRGLTSSSRGSIARVEASLDAGGTWRDAELQEPRLPRAFPRSRFPWRWDGSEHVLQSRAFDDQGFQEPTVRDLIAARGRNSACHNNGIKSRPVNSDGWVVQTSG